MQVLTLHEAPENRTPPLVHGFGFFGAERARDTLLAAVLRYCEQACVRARGARIIYRDRPLPRVVPPPVRNGTGAVRGARFALLA